MTPKPMMLPMLESEFPKPRVMASIVSSTAMPPASPMKIAQRITARNTCTLVFVMSSTSATRPMTRARSMRMPSSISISLKVGPTTQVG